MQLIYIIFI